MAKTFLTEFHTNVHFVYIIVGMVAVFVGFLHTVNICLSGWSMQHISGTQTQMKVVYHQNSNSESRCLSYVTIALLCSMVLCLSLVWETFGSFTISFTVDHQGWTMSDGTTLASVFFASIGLSILIGIVLSNFIPSIVLLAIDCFVSLTGAVFLTCVLPFSPIAIWVGSVLAGVGIGSMTPSILGVGKACTQFTGMLVSAIMTGGYLGCIVAPPIIGYILDNNDPIWFAYISIIYTSANVLLLGIIVLISLSKGCSCNKPEATCNSNSNEDINCA